MNFTITWYSGCFGVLPDDLSPYREDLKKILIRVNKEVQKREDKTTIADQVRLLDLMIDQHRDVAKMLSVIPWRTKGSNAPTESEGNK